MAGRTEIGSIIIQQWITTTDDGSHDVTVTYETSDGLSYIDTIGLLEMTKLAVNEEALRPQEDNLDGME